MGRYILLSDLNGEHVSALQEPHLLLLLSGMGVEPACEGSVRQLSIGALPQGSQPLPEGAAAIRDTLPAGEGCRKQSAAAVSHAARHQSAQTLPLFHPPQPVLPGCR